MSTWHALFYPLKAGSEETVKELFRTSGRPRFEVRNDDGDVVGRLLGTMAFVGKEMAVRVIEVDGPLPMVAGHMSRQPEVRVPAARHGDPGRRTAVLPRRRAGVRAGPPARPAARRRRRALKGSPLWILDSACRRRCPAPAGVTW